MKSFSFLFSGFAARTDLAHDGWKAVFNHLEREQSEFLRNETKFRSEEYRWPRDPLHTWSRLWEYPYVYEAIRRFHDQQYGTLPRVTDFGSGVTFFPFSVARLGCEVTCADIDPICAVDIAKAAEFIDCSLGSVKAATIQNGHMPIEAASQDIVYCVSVLEHIPNFESVIDEMSRVIKPGGQLILTVDVDLRGDLELSVGQFERLQTKLDKQFTKNLAERPVHPRNLLTTASSPYHVKNGSLLSLTKQILKGLLRGGLIGDDPRVGAYLTVYSTVLTRRTC